MLAAATGRCVRRLWCIQGIGLTKEKNLRGEDTATYNALATSSAIYKDKVNPSSNVRDRHLVHTQRLRKKLLSGKRIQQRFASDEIIIMFFRLQFRCASARFSLTRCAHTININNWYTSTRSGWEVSYIQCMYLLFFAFHTSCSTVEWIVPLLTFTGRQCAALHPNAPPS